MKPRRIIATDGREWPSARKAAADLGVSHEAIAARMRASGVLDLGKPWRRCDVQATDHLGRAYATESIMCAVYGITRQCYRYRRAIGMSLRAALTTPTPRLRRDERGVQ